MCIEKFGEIINKNIEMKMIFIVLLLYINLKVFYINYNKLLN